MQAKIKAALVDTNKIKMQLEELKRLGLIIDQYITDDCPADVRDAFNNLIEY